MCGIVGYIGKNKSLPILLSALKTLEYRGYDSSGIAYRINNKVKIVKDVGKIKVLENSGLGAREASDEICRRIGCEGIQAIGSKIVLYKKSQKKPKIELPQGNRK